MPDTHLILHIKGTASETAVLPKEEVHARVAEGKISETQLIWRPLENTWKPVKDLQDLLPVEHLILHVKGTEAETRQLPKPKVREAISKGEITHSQLIWRPEINEWKPVRELPELLPVEQMILHVKGTEAEFKQLPKPAVRKAISKGEITHSQLIWRPNEHAWKQVRELPELLPSQRLAPAPTAKAVSPSYAPEENVIPESPTGPVERALATSEAKPQVVAAESVAPKPRIANAAPQPRVVAVEQAHVVPQAGVAPAAGDVASPQPRVATVAPQPRLVVAEQPKPKPQSQSPVATPQPRVAAAGAPPRVIPRVAVAAGATPAVVVPQVVAQVKVAAGQTPSAQAVPVLAAIPLAKKPVLKVSAAPRPTPVLVRPTEGSEIIHEKEFPLFKWICIGLGAIILLTVAVNYLLVNRSLVSAMSQTPYSNVTVYGHLGAFVQPNVIVIHVPPSALLNKDNFSTFLVALAQSTPVNPISHDEFIRVALTSGWTADYSFSGYSWKELGEMGQDTEAQRQDYIMDELNDAGGNPLKPESTLNEAAQQAKRDLVWDSFVNTFCSAK